MKGTMKKVTAVLVATGLFAFSSSALATNGYFTHGVGTDSNVNISLVEELRLLEYGQRLQRGRRNVLAGEAGSTGRRLFDATLGGGARALARKSGAIAEGHLADLITVDTGSVDLHGLNGDDILDGWIFSSRGSVAEVWSAGRPIVVDGVHRAREVVEQRYRRTLDGLVARL